MRKLIWATVLVTSTVVGVLAQTTKGDRQIDQEHTAWIDRVMHSIDTVKPGMTRKDLSRIFVEEGGLSTRTQKRYVYSRCPYIKVDVEFAPITDGIEQSPEDKIVKISRPFLQYSIMD